MLFLTHSTPSSLAFRTTLILAHTLYGPHKGSEAYGVGLVVALSMASVADVVGSTQLEHPKVVEMGVRGPPPLTGGSGTTFEAIWAFIHGSLCEGKEEEKENKDDDLFFYFFSFLFCFSFFHSFSSCACE